MLREGRVALKRAPRMRALQLSASQTAAQRSGNEKQVTCNSYRETSGGIKLAHSPEFRLSGRNQLVDWHGFDRAVVKYQCLVQQRGRRDRICLRAVTRFVDHVVDASERLDLRRSDLQRCRRLGLLARIPPHNRCAAFWR